MNDHPDAFEWSLLKRSFLGLDMIFLGAYTVAVWLALSAPIQGPNSMLVAALYAAGFVVAALALWWAALLPQGSPTLYPLSLMSTSADFLLSFGALALAGGSQAIGQGSFLATSVFFLFVLGFFSRDQWATVAFGAFLVGAAAALFLGWPQLFFHEGTSAPEIERGLTVIVFLTVPMVTGMVVLNNRLAETLTRRSREAAAQLAHLAYFDLESDLPNGLLLEKEMSEWSHQASDRLALVGFRLEGLNGLNETRGLEFTTRTVNRLALAFQEGLKRGLTDRKSTRLNSSHTWKSRMPSSA